MDLIRMAKDLGKEIQASEAYIRLAAAKTANDEDEALQEMIGKFNLKRIEINTLISQESIDNEKVSKLDAEVKELYKSIMTNKNMVAFNDAKNEMDSLMEKVNNILVAAINGMDPETADQVSSCGGSCSLMRSPIKFELCQLKLSGKIFLMHSYHALKLPC